MVSFKKAFVTLLILSLLLGLAYGGVLFYYIFYSMFFLLISTSIYIAIINHYIKIEINFEADYLYAGDTADCTTILKCEVDLPVPYIEIRSAVFETAFTEYTAQLVSLTTEESHWIKNSIVFHKRGIYNLGKVNLKIRDVFNVIELRKNIITKDYVKVYPKIYEMINLTSGGKDIFRDSIDFKGNNEDQFTVRDVRKYRQGDSLKRIHWKLSARYGELYVKNFENISGEEIVIFVDLNKKNNDYDIYGVYEERVVDMAISLINMMRKKDIQTKVYVNSKVPREFNILGKEDFNSLLEYFINQESDSELDFSEYIQKNYYKIHRVNKLVAVTTKIDEKVVSNVIGIKNSGYSIALYHSLEEKKDLQLSEELKLRGIECLGFQQLISQQGELV
ncbi:MAG: DUF58 domain-containing protein [Clostridiaceae bacterium]|nr:DUF58 domain-containing protein [Clostridiaceae bacterium]